MRQNSWHLKTCEVKETRYKRLTMIWIHLYDIWEMVKLEGKKAGKYLPGMYMRQTDGLQRDWW